MTKQAVQGFQAGGIHCGIKLGAAPDLALVISDRSCHVAGMFTTNKVKAACVQYNQALITQEGATIRAVVANSGNANACTGEQGMRNNSRMAEEAAHLIGCSADQVLVLSTGVIGVQLPMQVILPGIATLHGAVNADGWEQANRAIMTTDTRPKLASVRTTDGYTITGIAKGAGMIAPNMATMLAVIATDAAVEPAALNAALHAAADASFNRIVVDGDMSTNDTVLLLANGASGVQVPPNDPAFQGALQQVCVALAQAIVRDGEGASRFVTLHITGAETEEAARAVARAIATSPLCKTAFYGADPNWGRVLAAAGRAGVDLLSERLGLWLLDAQGGESIQLVQNGEPLDYDEPAAILLMQGPEWGLWLDLGQGPAETTVWTCDLSHEYVTINGHYRT